MTRFFDKLMWLIPAGLIFAGLVGCADPDAGGGDDYLIRVGERTVTVYEFKEAFEIAKTAYPHKLAQKSKEIQKAQQRFLNQMILEMVLLERAQELEIAISDSEFEKALTAIKGDYPEGEFEKTLLETAISYESWEKRLRTRLLMEKVIYQELQTQVNITADDIAEFYEENYKGKNLETERAEDINALIVQQLRRKKAEEAYQAWIKKLREKYAIEINTRQWQKITGLENIRTKQLAAREKSNDR
ncbi:MAG: SurA N-terminal domain-containing protein [Desulfobacterales bacterium]|nr:MAG: SurA N-terminal domain-containing protein [Desulfobacterales bacterium]